MATITPFYRSANKDFTLVNGDCVSVLEAFDFQFDMIFADPPYFLASGGISVQSGKDCLLKWLTRHNQFSAHFIK